MDILEAGEHLAGIPGMGCTPGVAFDLTSEPVYQVQERKDFGTGVPWMAAGEAVDKMSPTVQTERIPQLTANWLGLKASRTKDSTGFGEGWAFYSCCR
jgi:hypothetical protein